VLAIFAKEQYSKFQEGAEPPAPLLYPFVIGKVFVIFRLLMAYASDDIGVTIDYFITQEFIITVTHVLYSATILPHFGDDPFKLKDMKNVIRLVTFLEALKTLFCFVYWRFLFTPGFLGHSFNRLPSISSQIFGLVLLHGVLDFLEFLAQVFTMFIAKRAKCDCSKGSHEQLTETPASDTLEARFVRFNLLSVDGYWKRHLFVEQNRDSQVKQECLKGMDALEAKYKSCF